MRCNRILPAALTLLLLITVQGAAATGGDVGWYTIHCNVDGADVYFDGTYKGQINSGALSVGVYTTGTPYSTITVQKSGYYTAATSLPATPSAGETSDVYITLNPMASPTQSEYGSLYISTNPTGARVHINDIYQGLSPLTVSSLRAGSCRVEAEYNGYQNAETDVYVTAGTIQNVYLTLQSPGSISVTSSPTDAFVSLNGAIVGRTPYVITGLSTETVEISVTKNGYYNWKQSVNVYDGGQVSVHASLESIEQSQEILVTSDPAGAKIHLDGIYKGETMADQPFPIGSVTEGQHTLSLTLDGYPNYITNVNIVQGGTPVTVNAVMDESQPQQNTGSVKVTSTPAGAMIYLDNAYTGLITPATVTDVNPGEHTITLRLSDYQDAISKVTVTAGETEPLTIGLAAGSSQTSDTPSAIPTAITPGFGFMSAIAAFLAVCIIIPPGKRRED
ncbi:PEGA domain-containing protein [Methanoplanus endosymbiosus]|uniref:PEGA domain-containing protein n=1 Tax=Methanoplanus endosymbiosus TaxID=33865 RepID=A0A9E7THY3_9EURY|nr:PEGA domain-containing protein [Methanoplanus endosymbiosus]UUX91513.1 PEGA domain-containing protein [Methanoplanus endosymbiosus]